MTEDLHSIGNQAAACDSSQIAKKEYGEAFARLIPLVEHGDSVQAGGNKASLAQAEEDAGSQVRRDALLEGLEGRDKTPGHHVSGNTTDMGPYWNFFNIPCENLAANPFLRADPVQDEVAWDLQHTLVPIDSVLGLRNDYSVPQESRYQQTAAADRC